MNRKLLVTMWITLGVIALMFLVPPWQYHFKAKSVERTVPGPYRLIFLGAPEVPVTSSDKYGIESFDDEERSEWNPEVDWTRLLIPCGIFAVIGLALAFTLRASRSEQPQFADSPCEEARKPERMEEQKPVVEGEVLKEPEHVGGVSNAPSAEERKSKATGWAPATRRAEEQKPESAEEMSRNRESLRETEKTSEAARAVTTAPEGMLLIPKGSFTMGSDDSDNERPAHRVWIDSFYMDKYEVTNRQYGEFLKVTGHRPPRYWDDEPFNATDQPVVGVSWEDAVEYCNWSDKRLPTEAEWEKAARGGLEGKKYPWGDVWPDWNATYGLEEQEGKSTPVGSYQPNGYGLYDMSGNVWEWCADWYEPTYFRNSPAKNPPGPSSGQYRVARGGSWNSNHDSLRCASRMGDNPSMRSYLNGFRCAKTP